MNKPHKTGGCSPPDPNPLITTCTIDESVGAAQHRRPKRPNPVSIPCSTKSLGVGERRLWSPEEVLAELPNRFDPFEALDQLLELSPIAGTRHNVGLLRAYITGMER